MVWLNRCTSEVICKHKHGGQRSLLWTQWRQRQERVNRGPWDAGETIYYKGFSEGQKLPTVNVLLKVKSKDRKEM